MHGATAQRAVMSANGFSKSQASDEIRRSDALALLRFAKRHRPSRKRVSHYDSTVGYNETIGYRAGTSQVFKHPDVDHLLELPLHIMDTALFYPSYMNLSDDQAGAAMLPLDRECNKIWRRPYH